jgi:hypothetical protein
LERHGVRVEDELEVQNSKPLEQRTETTSPGDSRSLTLEESRSPESVADIGKLIIEGGHSRYIENDLWSELGDEVRSRSSGIGSSQGPISYSRSPIHRHTLVCCICGM